MCRGLMKWASPDGPMRHEQLGPAGLLLLPVRVREARDDAGLAAVVVILVVGVQQWLISEPRR